MHDINAMIWTYCPKQMQQISQDISPHRNLCLPDNLQLAQFHYCNPEGECLHIKYLKTLHIGKEAWTHRQI